MNRTLKKVLIATGIIIAILVIFIAGFMMRMKSEFKDMNAVETKEIVNNIYSVKDSFVNFYLVKDSDQYIAIDSGNTQDVVSGELKKLNIDPDKVIAVMFTHTDRDHVGALKLFKNAKIYLAKQEEQMLNGEKTKFFMSNKIDAKEYSFIEDQQVLQLKKTKIKGISTPGHTSGSMSYLVNDKYLFTGDALSLKVGKIGKFNDFFNMDSKTAAESIVKITGLPETEYIFTAHHGYTNDYKNAVKDWGK